MTNRRREIVLSDNEAQHELARRTRRGFLMAGLAAVGGFGAYEWITKAQQVDNAPWPQRKVLDLNGRISHAYLSDSHLMPEYPKSKISPIKVNGDIGVSNDFDPGAWRLQVANGAEDATPLLTLSMADIAALPKIEMTTLFCCIEGWSVVQSWAGARFSDFTKKYFPPGQHLPQYVYMATPDEDYYVGLDMKSVLHPQTLLAYERNGQPLEREHGAPLRLIIPVKYGIKNIKRIGLIRYTDDRPDDYWAEEGYDWFAGL
ncbi:MAG TPA: molybdopterin-dependent oxidoreductase [Bryobacteraceae bacterium]|jgi:DMSO/TMAO reductase YedYZ molybdopterin-dependent catalytic subunit